MNTLRKDTTATQEVVGVLIFSVLLVVSLSAGYVIAEQRVKEEHAPDATVEQSSIEAQSPDQLEIKPLVGDDVDLENAEVRVIFEDRNAPDAVLTNLQDAKDHSQSVQVSDTQTIQTAGDYKPVNQTVTYYERNGTTDQVELNTYKWQKEVDVEKKVRRYEVWNDSGDKKTVDSASGPPEKYEHSDDGKVVYKYKAWFGEGWSGSTTCYAIKKANCNLDYYYDKYDRVYIDRTGVKTENVTETVTAEYPVKPDEDWEKVSDEPVGTNTYELENPVPRYDEKQKEVTVGYKVINTTQEVDRSKTVYVASEDAPEADTDDDSMLATLAPVGVAEGGWTDDPGSVWDDFYGDNDNSSESSDPSDTTETDESSGSDWLLNDDRYVDSDDSQEGSDDAAADPDADTDDNGNAGNNTDANDVGPDLGSADQAFDTANENAAFLVDEDTSPLQNSAIGMGGTAGSKAAGTWTQGEFIIVQLDRPLLFEGERVTVQIVDSETNSLIMDRTVRIQDTKRFQFGPDGSEASEKLPGPPNRNISIDHNVSVDPGDGGDYSISPPDNTGDGIVGGGGGGGDGDSGTPTTGGDNPTVDINNSDGGIDKDEDEFKFIPDDQDAQFDITYEIEGEPNPERSVPPEIDEFVGGNTNIDDDADDEDSTDSVFSDDDDDNNGGSSDSDSSGADPVGPGLSP